jgi:hypothetical protein
MRPLLKDITFVQNDDYDLLIRFEENGSPLDVRDATFKSQIRVKAGDENVVAEFDVDMSDAENGNVVLQLSENVTNISAGKYVYDIEIRNVKGKKTVVGGNCEILAEVTKNGLS